MKRECAVLALMMGALGACPAVADAHRLDEYLQAAQIAIEPGRVIVDLYLTPGVEVAPGILRAIDRSGDGVGADDLARYSAQLLPHLRLSADGTDLALAVTGHEAAPLAALLEGVGAIHITVEAALPPRAGSHSLVFRNTFESGMGVYLANAMLPRSRHITVARQRRDERQQQLQIEYNVAEGVGLPGVVVAGNAIWLALLAMIIYWRRSGRVHVSTGPGT